MAHLEVWKEWMPGEGYVTESEMRPDEGEYECDCGEILPVGQECYCKRVE